MLRDCVDSGMAPRPKREGKSTRRDGITSRQSIQSQANDGAEFCRFSNANLIGLLML